MLGRLRFLGNIAVCCPTSGVGRHLRDDVRRVRGALHPHQHLHHCFFSVNTVPLGQMEYTVRCSTLGSPLRVESSG
ncbi:hypothetical protein E2C01_074563 [Portunus trituberculatus]|uniref:Uncharacterized protein n=1 Tax=Portunus trituberculatus TaxID=210409 RepID=A0A5B7I3M1_PORTR|nr:hypothetical protein [Portunus trituberculatus]